MVGVPTVIDELVRKSAEAAFDFDYGSLPIKPRLPVAVLTCMDARLSTPRLLGVEPGDIHVLRNAGGVVSRTTSPLSSESIAFLNASRPTN